MEQVARIAAGRAKEKAFPRAARIDEVAGNASLNGAFGHDTAATLYDNLRLESSPSETT
jgi:hypothetical protein